MPECNNRKHELKNADVLYCFRDFFTVNIKTYTNMFPFLDKKNFGQKRL